jgi:hypothetical protein
MQNELTIQENSGSDHFFTVFSNKDYDGSFKIKFINSGLFMIFT